MIKMPRQFNFQKEDYSHVVKAGNLKERIYIKGGKPVTMINLNGKWVEKPKDSDDSNS
jgi:hypothetical protein